LSPTHDIDLLDLKDFSGGTVDITVQEIKEDGDIKQIYMANGGDWAYNNSKKM
jgi:hypothetical protein